MYPEQEGGGSGEPTIVLPTKVWFYIKVRGRSTTQHCFLNGLAGGIMLLNILGDRIEKHESDARFLELGTLQQ